MHEEKDATDEPVSEDELLNITGGEDPYEILNPYMNADMRERIRKIVRDYKKKYRSCISSEIAAQHRMLHPQDGWNPYGKDMRSVIEMIYREV